MHASIGMISYRAVQEVLPGVRVVIQARCVRSAAGRTPRTIPARPEAMPSATAPVRTQPRSPSCPEAHLPLFLYFFFFFFFSFVFFCFFSSLLPIASTIAGPCVPLTPQTLVMSAHELEVDHEAYEAAALDQVGRRPGGFGILWRSLPCQP